MELSPVDTQEEHLNPGPFSRLFSGGMLERAGKTGPGARQLRKYLTLAFLHTQCTDFRVLLMASLQAPTQIQLSPCLTRPHMGALLLL